MSQTGNDETNLRAARRPSTVATGGLRFEFAIRALSGAELVAVAGVFPVVEDAGVAERIREAGLPAVTLEVA